MYGGPLQRSEAVVLRHLNYAESDRIITLFTANFGIIKGFAKGARNSRKRFGAAFEPFTQAVFHWRWGKGELPTLIEADLMSSRDGLRTDLRRLALAGYGVELVELLTGDCAHQVMIYELLCSYLDYLDSGGDGSTGRLLFELRLIYFLGYIPHLLHCSECLKIFHEEQIRFDSRRGGSLCLSCSGGKGLVIGLGTVGTLAKCLRVSHRRFEGFKFGSTTLDDASLILGQILQQLLPRELKSLKFLARIEV